MTHRIILADKKYRKKIFIIYFVSVVLGGILIWWGLPWAKGYIQNMEPDRALDNLNMFVRFMFLSIVPFCVYILSIGHKVLKHQQFPPPDTKVIKDTKLIEGEKALIRGRLVIAIALSLIVVCLIGGFYLPYKLSKTFASSATPADNLVCKNFQKKLFNLKHQKNIVESVSFEFKNKVYKGCKLIFETKWSVIGIGKDPTDMFFPHEGSELYQMGWRSYDSYLADGPGSSFNVIRNEDILCTIRWNFVSFIDRDTSEFVTGDDLSCQIRCGKEYKN